MRRVRVCSSVAAFAFGLLASGCGAEDAGPGPGTGGSAGTGGTSGSGGAAGMGSGLPDDNSADAIGRFLDAMGYEATGWTAETPGPRMQSSAVSPHQRVRVFLNDTLRASQQAGNGDVGGTPHSENSMAVKLLFDAGDTVVGKAAMWKTEAGSAPASWTYYCYGPEARCSTDRVAFPRDAPAYGQGQDAICFGCHNGVVFTKLPLSPR